MDIASIITIENCFSPETLYAVEAEWPDQNWQHWHTYDNGKLATHDESRIPPACKHVLHQMAEMTNALSAKDGHKYFADWSFYGAGLHCMPSKSRLGTHLDSEIHPNKKWLRAYSMVLHINSEWDKSWGGQFYFKNSLESDEELTYDVTFNRLVCFKCSNNSYHGVRQLTCPPNVSRKTLAVFFWRQANITEIDTLRQRAYFFD